VLAAGTKTFAGSAAGHATPTDGAIFTSAPLDRSIVVAGFPSMRLSASVTAPRVSLIATLYDRPASGSDRRIGQFAINPELRDGFDKVSLVTPAQRYDLNPPGFPLVHHLKAGHRLVLRVSTADEDKIPMFAEDPNVTVFTGPGATEVTLPTVPASRLVADKVPFKR
jgi:predicted acyl esterase